MKQVNFSHPGGFPLEQETLERLQTAYRFELFEALKKHLSIQTNFNYIIAPASNTTKGWAIIHQEETDAEGISIGILYPIAKGTPTDYLKATRKTTNLIYGDGKSQTAYYDYEAEYVSATGNSVTNENETVVYYDLKKFETVKDLKSIETILNSHDTNITALKANINTIEGNIQTMETNIGIINQSYLPINGSKAMQGDLNLGNHHLYLNNLNTVTSNNPLLVLNDANQVVKNDTLIQSLINRITDLENKPATAVPIGMIAIWGKTAPFPEGWEEYVPLRGRMPIGLKTNDTSFDTLLNAGGDKNQTLEIDQIPSHSHKFTADIYGPGGYLRFGANSDYTTAPSTENTESTGGGLPFSILNPYRVVYFIEYTGRPSDTTAPTSPVNLKASNITKTSLTLNWTASTDNVGVTNYLVYKDNSNTPIAEIGKDFLTYNVIGLSLNTNYNFYVKAKDAAGNISASSNILNVTTKALDTTPPTTPAYFSCFNTGQGNIGLQWGTSTDDDSPITYELSRKIGSGNFIVFKTIPDTYHYEVGSPNTTYSYRVRAIDPSGNASDYKEASITLNSF